MKKSFITRIINLLAVIFMLFGYNQVLYAREKDEKIARLEAKLAEAEAAAAAVQEQASLYKDGTYTGSGEGFGGVITVEVTVAGGSITVIDVPLHDGEDGPYFASAEAIIDDILDAQSADVDTVSGATFSSTGIRSAVEKALQKAEAK